MKWTLPLLEVTAAGFGSGSSSQCQSSAAISNTKYALFCAFLRVQPECVGELLSELFVSVG